MMIASNITGLGVSSALATSTQIIQTKAEVLPSGSQSENIEKTDKKITVEEYVRNYFSDIPVIIEIARCESRFRQYDKDGNVLRGEQNSLDRGVMQINEYYHNDSSEKLGYNILTLEGNTSYTRYLFEKYGVKPWMSSSKCWGKTIAYSKYKEELAMK